MSYPFAPVPVPDRPEMSQQEASWHEHLAGMRAADAARSQGADPAAIDAFAAATAGPALIAGRSLQPASQGTIWTLQRVARLFAAWADATGMASAPDPDAPGTRELLELGLATLVFCDARAVWRELDSGDIAPLIAAAEDMMWELPLADQLALQAHFRTEMDRIRSLSGGAAADSEDTAQKKTPGLPAAGLSNAMPIRPQAQASPPSNGSPANTASPSPMPYGPPHSP